MEVYSSHSSLCLWVAPLHTVIQEPRYLPYLCSASPIEALLKLGPWQICVPTQRKRKWSREEQTPNTLRTISLTFYQKALSQEATLSCKSSWKVGSLADQPFFPLPRCYRRDGWITHSVNEAFLFISLQIIQ